MGYNERLLESEHKPRSMLQRAAFIQGLTVLTTFASVGLILIGHFSILKMCVKPDAATNPSALGKHPPPLWLSGPRQDLTMHRV